MMAEISPGRPLYVSLAYDTAEDFLYVVTVHRTVHNNMGMTPASGITRGRGNGKRRKRNAIY